MEKPQSNINIGDVVEIKYRAWPNCNGIQFRVEEDGVDGVPYYKGTVVKTTPYQQKKYPIGSEFKWSSFTGLIVVNSKKEQPTGNQVYIDHMYERLVQNATPEELIGLAERLDRAGKG